MLKIQPTQTPSFGLNTARKIRFDGETQKRIIDTVNFDNGKKLIITKGYDCNTLIYKLQYLKNEAGDWIKSKLRYYKGRKVIKELNNEKEV